MESALILKRMKGQPTGHGNEEDRTRVWVLSTGDTDRDGETVSPTGGDFSEYMLNPTVQWNHDTDSEPIGQMVGKPWNAYVGEGTDFPEIAGPKRMALLGRIKFSKANPFAEQIWNQVQEGSVKAGSISFVPLGGTKRNSNGGNHYDKWKLLEFTICSVPSNPSAVATRHKSVKNSSGRSRSLVFNRKGGSAMLRRKCWINRTAVLSNGAVGKSAWVLTKDGGLDEETKDYLMQRGLDEVRIEESEPGSAEWVEEEMAEPEHQGVPSMDKGKFPGTLTINGRVYADSKDIKRDFGDAVMYDIGRRAMQGTKQGTSFSETGEKVSWTYEKAMTGANPPEGKTEEVADDVAVRAEELSAKGVEEEVAVEAAMEEQGVPKSMRPAVKALVKGRVSKGVFNVGDGVNTPRGYGTITSISGNQVTVKLKDGKEWSGSTNQISGGLPTVPGKSKAAPGDVCRTKNGQLVLVRRVVGKTCRVVKVNGEEEEEKAKNLKVKLKSAEWGLPSKITGNSGDLQSKLTDWYGKLTNTLKFLAPTLKDADLTGEEKRKTEEAVDEAFMKVAKDMDVKPSNLCDVGTTKAVGEDSIVPQDSVPNRTDDKDDSISPQTTQSPDWTGQSDSTVPQGKRLALPKSLFKSYVRKVAEEVAEKVAPKLRSTVVKRACKFIDKALPCEDMDDKACMRALAKADDDTTDVEKGLLAAGAAAGKKKWQKKYGACGKAACTKELLCPKCVKKLTKALEGDLENLDSQSPDMLVMGDERGDVASFQPVGVMPWGQGDKSVNKELGGTDEPSPSASLSTSMDAPGSIPTKSKSDDDETEEEKRAKRLLAKMNGSDDLSDEDAEKLMKALDRIEATQTKARNTIYATTAIRPY